MYQVKNLSYILKGSSHLKKAQRNQILTSHPWKSRDGTFEGCYIRICTWEFEVEPRSFLRKPKCLNFLVVKWLGSSALCGQKSVCTVNFCRPSWLTPRLASGYIEQKSKIYTFPVWCEPVASRMKVQCVISLKIKCIQCFTVAPFTT